MPSAFSLHEAYGSELVLFVVAKLLRLSTTLPAPLSSKDLLLFILGVPAQASLEPSAVPWLGNPRRPRSFHSLWSLASPPLHSLTQAKSHTDCGFLRNPNS